MSECKARTQNDQKECKYYIKSTHKDCCMFYIFDQFCTCLDAQTDADKSPEERNQEILDEMKEAEI